MLAGHGLGGRDKAGVYQMSRVCHFTGKRTVAGRSIARRGKAKYLGGVGRKITGISKRKFKPNIQKVRAVVDGKVCRVKVSAKAIRMGLIQKPAKRNYKPAEQATG
jgi:large subunit ribosomal protein L28